MTTICVTGSQGFIGSYICQELLNHDYKVIGLDNFSKYGVVSRPHDNHQNFTLIRGNVINIKDDLRDVECEYFIACAAMIGGIQYFHKYAYDLLATNERILASTFDFAIDLFKRGILKRIVALSSSMVFESTNKYPTPEDEVRKCPPPLSTYGFQKLAVEYFCKGANEQYGLPFTIIRPFNCIGLGENKAINEHEISSGNVKMTMSHVVPDLIYKCLSVGRDGRLPILGKGNQIRHYTYGGDIAKATRIAMESDIAINDDFNISSPRPLSVKELVEIIWKQIHGNAELKIEYCDPFEYDVQIRSPDITKARNLLGVECDTSIEDALPEIIDWVRSYYFNKE